jgi:hypothetical protein
MEHCIIPMHILEELPKKEVLGAGLHAIVYGDGPEQVIKKYYTDGGVPSRKGAKNSQEHIEKFRKSYREKYESGEIINFWKNKTLPEDLKRKVSETKKRQYKLF